jgi:hypothetical protein
MTPGSGDPSNPISPYSSPARTNTGAEPGKGTFDPNQPRLLPEDIIRRSQNGRPYEVNPGEYGSLDSNPGNGTSRQPSTHPPGSSNASNQEAGTENPGQSTVQESVTNSSPQPISENPANANQTGQPGQSTNQDVTNIPQQNPREPGSPATSGNTGSPQPAGTPGQPSSGQPLAGSPSNPFEPAMPNFLKMNPGRMMNPVETYQRRWGLSDPRASIGFEREITVRVEPARLVVGNAFAVAYDAQTTKDQLSAGLLEAIERTARNWGRPPMSFYWVPTIKFQVGNDEVPVYRHLTATAKAWGLETSAEGISP